jgi:hypothetical protein
VFQLKTHTHLFEADKPVPKVRSLSSVTPLHLHTLHLHSSDNVDCCADSSTCVGGCASSHAHVAVGNHSDGTVDAGLPVVMTAATAPDVSVAEEEEDVLGLGGSLAWLALITVAVSLASGVLVNAIRGAADQ